MISAFLKFCAINLVTATLSYPKRYIAELDHIIGDSQSFSGYNCKIKISLPNHHYVAIEY
jgi:hypothetical protein